MEQVQVHAYSVSREGLVRELQHWFPRKKVYVQLVESVKDGSQKFTAWKLKGEVEGEPLIPMAR